MAPSHAIVANLPACRQVRGTCSKLPLPRRSTLPCIDNVKRRGPSIAKARLAPIGELRTRPLIRCTDYRWRELFEGADVISEGAIRKEEQGDVYYGSTSILLKDQSHGGRILDAERTAVQQLLEIDPHARIRAVRIACLEAQLRANTDIESVRAEIGIGEDVRGVCITVDVEARAVLDVMRRSASATPGRKRKP